MSSNSSVELLGTLESEFTDLQIDKFKEAFKIFDVNGDGRISTDEIFETLVSMGSQITSERQKKIKEAVTLCDTDSTNSLNFAQFVRFMKIMDDHNRQVDSIVDMDIQHTFASYCCVTVAIQNSMGEWAPCALMRKMVFLYMFVHGVAMLVLPFLTDSDADGVLADEPKHWNTNIVEYLQRGNALFLLHLISILLIRSKRKIAKVALADAGLRKSPSNVLLFYSRAFCGVDALASWIFLLGYKEGIVDAAGLDVAFVTHTLQVVFFHISLSDFWYFGTIDELSRLRDAWKVGLLDVFVLNFVRALATAVHVPLSIPLVLLDLLATVLYVFTWCIGLLNLHESSAKAYRFFFATMFWSGPRFFLGWFLKSRRPA